MVPDNSISPALVVPSVNANCKKFPEFSAVPEMTTVPAWDAVTAGIVVPLLSSWFRTIRVDVFCVDWLPRSSPEPGLPDVSVLKV